MPAWTPAQMPDLTGLTAVVTGANNGLGFYTVAGLVSRGARVVMACRNLEKADRARTALIDKGARADNLIVEQLDLASLVNVREFTERVGTAYPRIDLLINNAGIMALDQAHTEDGHDLQFGVNHLGHMELTLNLLPSVLAAPHARVVTLSSIAHFAGQLDLGDPDFERRRYNRWTSYSQSKLANLLFSRELGRRFEAIGTTAISLAAHPGYSRTDLGAGASTATTAMIKFSQLFGSQSAEAGAHPTLRAATDPDARNGDYFGPSLVILGKAANASSSYAARSTGLGAALWTKSLEMLGRTEPEVLDAKRRTG